MLTYLAMTWCGHRPYMQVIHALEGCKQAAFWPPSWKYFSTCKYSCSISHLCIWKHVFSFQIMKVLSWRKHSSCSFWIVAVWPLRTSFCQQDDVDANPWSRSMSSILQPAAFLQVILPWASRESPIWNNTAKEACQQIPLVWFPRKRLCIIFYTWHFWKIKKMEN